MIWKTGMENHFKERMSLALSMKLTFHFSTEIKDITNGFLRYTLWIASGVVLGLSHVGYC